MLLELTESGECQHLWLVGGGGGGGTFENVDREWKTVVLVSQKGI